MIRIILVKYNFIIVPTHLLINKNEFVFIIYVCRLNRTHRENVQPNLLNQ